MLSGILFLKGFEDLCGLPFQNLDFIIYWQGLAKFYLRLNLHVIGDVFMNLRLINFVGMSRTLGKFIYHVVIITVSEVFYISIL